MKPKREYVDYARDVRDAAEKARLFTGGIDFEGFQANDEKIFAVIRALGNNRRSKQENPGLDS